MKFSKIMTMAAIGVCSISGWAADSDYVNIDGFFGSELSENWSVVTGNEPVSMKMLERQYGVALAETNDIEASKQALAVELAKYFEDAELSVLLPILNSEIDAEVLPRHNLGMSDTEVIEGDDSELLKSMDDFVAYKNVKNANKKVAYVGDVAIDKASFQGMTIADMIDMLKYMQLPVKRNCLEIIAPVGNRAIVMNEEFIPVTLGDVYDISGRMFCVNNPTEEEVEARAGMPESLDVAHQIMEKKLGGFIVSYYTADKEFICDQIRYFVTADYHRKRCNWKFDVAMLKGLVPAYVKVGVTVAAADPNDPADAPIEFSDVRLRLVSQTEYKVTK